MVNNAEEVFEDLLRLSTCHEESACVAEEIVGACVEGVVEEVEDFSVACESEHELDIFF